jgi:hemerythrin-like domain-containing protein
VIGIGGRPPPSFDAPVELILHCHRAIEERLATLERAAAALEAAPAEAAAAMRGILAALEATHVRHTEDEELSLWPRVIDDGCAALLDELTAEHRAMEAIHLSLRDVLLRAAPELHEELRLHARALASAYRDHMRREEEQVMPRVRSLDEAELRAIGLEMRIRRGGDRR